MVIGVECRLPATVRNAVILLIYNHLRKLSNETLCSLVVNNMESCSTEAPQTWTVRPRAGKKWRTHHNRRNNAPKPSQSASPLCPQEYYASGELYRNAEPIVNLLFSEKLEAVRIQ